MDQSERTSPNPADKGGAEDASKAKAERGNHSRPLRDSEEKPSLPSRSSSSNRKTNAKTTEKHSSNQSAHSKHPDADSQKGESADNAPEASSPRSPKSPSGPSHERRSKGVSGESPEQPAEGSKEKRDFIIPDEMLEPPTMVDTSANKQMVKQRQVFHENPNIHYLNGESLSRPMTLPPSAKAGIVAIIIIAAILAAAAFYMYFDATTNEPARERARMEQQLGRDVQLDLPDMLSLLELDDATIDAQLKATGATFFDRSPVGTAKEYEIVKLPSDVSLEEAALMYASGISKLTPSQAVTLLNGAWDLMIDRSNGLNMVLHYADFKSGSEASAIANAIAAENLERGTETDSGENDGYGNHYTMGTIMINGKSYDWTVSAVALKEMYSIAGLPDNAVYVGVRIRGAAE